MQLTSSSSSIHNIHLQETFQTQWVNITLLKTYLQPLLSGSLPLENMQTVEQPLPPLSLCWCLTFKLIMLLPPTVWVENYMSDGVLISCVHMGTTAYRCGSTKRPPWVLPGPTRPPLQSEAEMLLRCQQGQSNCQRHLDEPFLHSLQWWCSCWADSIHLLLSLLKGFSFLCVRFRWFWQAQSLHGPLKPTWPPIPQLSAFNDNHDDEKI